MDEFEAWCTKNPAKAKRLMGGMKRRATPSTVTTRLDRVAQYSKAFQSFIDALEYWFVPSSRTMTAQENQNSAAGTIASEPQIRLRLQNQFPIFAAFLKKSIMPSTSGPST